MDIYIINNNNYMYKFTGYKSDHFILKETILNG